MAVILGESILPVRSRLREEWSARARHRVGGDLRATCATRLAALEHSKLPLKEEEARSITAGQPMQNGKASQKPPEGFRPREIVRVFLSIHRICFRTTSSGRRGGDAEIVWSSS